ncbi:hypothetical protein [Paenibacillus sp. DMB5]|uniref:hypothetical protein n=1 Tax=Paenibacillus sp. DMB5 TaxID=1780103 RepID=UPI00076C0B5D|nr:hypothetical protein [Paenibacillus sp. DMB5]KUP22060.1 hypothetical protein AWJ19_21355 [Paenibacillus sp. DMB5]
MYIRNERGYIEIYRTTIIPALELAVFIRDTNGKILTEHTQPITSKHGENLFSIMQEELGFFQLNEQGIFELKYFVDPDPEKTASRLLGNIAEAIVVKNCNRDKKVNRKWAAVARKGKNKTKTLDKYQAVGTGLLSTMKQFPSKYNKTNPQRDIIWIDKNDKKKELLQVTSEKTGGVSAGLQLKVSSAGKKYILEDLKSERYEVPLVYFGLKNDFDEVANEVYKGNKNIEIGVDFVNSKAIDRDSYDELLEYKPLIKGLLKGRIKPADLFSERVFELMLEDDIARVALIKTALETKNSKLVTAVNA